MIEGKSVLAVVPARSGSKGIPGKNMRRLLGTSLIGWTGRTLAECPWLDRRVISTDSREYAEEARRFGLDAPFLRPPELSGDESGAVETVQHALKSVEELDGQRYDVVLVVEPTSPLRRAEDVERCARRLVVEDADAVVSVSPLDQKFHSHKQLMVRDGRLAFASGEAEGVTRRQQLEPRYWRNGICYAVTRQCLVERDTLFGPNTLADIVERPVSNIDSPLDLEWTEFLLGREGRGPSRRRGPASRRGGG